MRTTKALRALRSTKGMITQKQVNNTGFVGDRNIFQTNQIIVNLSVLSAYYITNF